MQKPNQEKIFAGVSYDGPKDAKKIDLASVGEPVYIVVDLSIKEEEKLIKLLR